MNYISEYKVENFALNTKWQDLPKYVKEKAVACTIDIFTALMLGSKGDQIEAGISMANSVFKSGSVGVLGTKEKFGLTGSVVVMGHSSNSFDIDDGYNMLKGHPGAGVIPGVLGGALEKKVSYKEFLTTFIIAYEVSLRMGLALHDHYSYYHGTGSYCGVGNALALGRYDGFDKEMMNTALSIADFNAPMTPVMRAVSYPSMNKDGVPYGAIIGAMAYNQAMSGVTGKTYLLEEDKYRHYADTLGKEYEVMNLYFKPYPCCRWAHAPILAAKTLMNENNIDVGDIKEVKMYSFDAATKLSKLPPVNTDSAQYNICYTIACALVDKEFGYSQVTQENLQREDILDMMIKIDFEVDEDMESRFPKERICRIKIQLNDGTEFVSEDTTPEGDGENIEWVEDKFKNMTKLFISEEEQNFILEQLKDVENCNLNEVVNYINNRLN
jgi:2-methylcitrate dehydratase PrpD